MCPDLTTQLHQYQAHRILAAIDALGKIAEALREEQTEPQTASSQLLRTANLLASIAHDLHH